MRSARGILVGVLVAGVALIAVIGLTSSTTLAFTLGVPVAGPVVTVAPGEVVCQVDIAGPDDVTFDEIDLVLGTFEKKGPPLTVVVQDADLDVLAQTAVPGGYPDITVEHGQTIALGKTVEATPGMSVCVRNDGEERDVALYGAPDIAAFPTAATFFPVPDEDGGEKREDEEPESDEPRLVGADVALEFHRSEQSYLSLVDDIAERMRLFRGPLVPAWVYLGGVLVLLGLAAAALTTAVGAAERGPVRADGPDGDGPGDATASSRTGGW